MLPRIAATVILVLLLLSSCASANIRDDANGIQTLSPRTSGSVRMLSYYLLSLLNSPGDTAVYVLDSGAPGPNMLLVAGAHGAEIAGIRAAIGNDVEVALMSGIIKPEANRAFEFAYSGYVRFFVTEQTLTVFRSTRREIFHFLPAYVLTYNKIYATLPEP